MSWLFKSNRPYIKEHQKKLVLNHKYQGLELSYSYNYFYSPVCAAIVEYLPTWLAPNMITFIGLLANIVPAVLIVALYGNDFYGDVPSWFLIMCGFAFFFYMLCDNSDGKQARRIGASSPLGMLFDHGADCFTTIINNLIIQRVVQIGNNNLGVFFLTSSTIPFYFGTMEQYYSGELVMQEVNGVDDGAWGYMALCFITAYYGVENVWGGTVSLFGLPPVKPFYFLGLTLYSFFFCSLITNFKNIYTKRDRQHFKTMFRPASFLAHIGFYFLNVAFFMMAIYSSPSNVTAENPRRVCFAMGGQYILVTLRMQYSFVIQEVFNPFRRTVVLTWALLTIQTLSSIFWKQSIMHEPTLYLLIVTYTGASIAHLIWFVLQELCEILNINVFVVTRPRRPVPIAAPETAKQEKKMQ